MILIRCLERGTFFVRFNVPHILVFRELMNEGEIRWLPMLWVLPCFNLELGISYIKFRGLELVCGPWTPTGDWVDSPCL